MAVRVWLYISINQLDMERNYFIVGTPSVKIKLQTEINNSCGNKI